SSEEAAGLLGRQAVDVLLLDILLPGMNGIEFLGRVRAEHPHLPVVLISAASSIRPVMKAIEQADADYIRKPFDIDELRLVVARAIRVGGLRRRLAELEQEPAGRPPATALSGRSLKENVEAYERALIQEALHRAQDVQTRAARLLGTTRRILRYRMEKLGIPAGGGGA
ncbi:MAG TPA: response regulator, partial [Kiritimatiellia bacterium]|nr:response regulator [Kiritimatiellia bacterium]